MTYLHTGNTYLTVAGQQMAYRELGRGQSDLPLLLLTHLAATLDNWDPKLIDLLAQRQHLILVDLPGVGASQGRVGTTISEMAEQAIRFIQALGYEQINLLGLSMGGMSIMGQELGYTLTCLDGALDSRSHQNLFFYPKADAPPRFRSLGEIAEPLNCIFQST